MYKLMIEYACNIILIQYNITIARLRVSRKICELSEHLSMSDLFIFKLIYLYNELRKTCYVSNSNIILK